MMHIVLILINIFMLIQYTEYAYMGRPIELYCKIKCVWVVLRCDFSLFGRLPKHVWIIFWNIWIVLHSVTRALSFLRFGTEPDGIEIIQQLQTPSNDQGSRYTIRIPRWQDCNLWFMIVYSKRIWLSRIVSIYICHMSRRKWIQESKLCNFIDNCETVWQYWNTVSVSRSVL